MLELNTKVNTDYIVSSCWRLTFYIFLGKVLTVVLLISFLKHELANQSLHIMLNILHFILRAVYQTSSKWDRLNSHISQCGCLA